MNGVLQRIVAISSNARAVFASAGWAVFVVLWVMVAGGSLFAGSGSVEVISRSEVGNAALTAAAWCPFCTALKPTLTEEIEATDAVVFAKVLGPGALTEDGFDRKLRLQVSQILKGKSFVAENDEFETIAPATLEPGQECLVMGVLTDRMMWSTPMKLSERSREYVLAVQTLPLEGPERVKFFLNYLEDSESFMAFDAYDEFARAPYEVVKAIKADMNRDNLLKWVQDPEVSINRKRLYFTLIGVCGLPEDLPLLERLITSPEKRDRAALDSLIACYLTLSGADGVKLIEDRFLRDKDAEYVDTYAAVAALRFHGTESDVIPVPRIVEAVRLLLDRPEVADLVIADLARWKDWTVTDRLVEMFKNANDKTQWVRVPIVHFLRVNPDPAAKAKIEELRVVDPQSVRRALAFFELEAAMQDETDAEDAEFEQQLKELEKEKSKEQESDKGKKKEKEQESGSGSGSGGAGDKNLDSAPVPTAAEDGESADNSIRLTAFRPVVESATDLEPSSVASTSLLVAAESLVVKSAASDTADLVNESNTMVGETKSSQPVGMDPARFARNGTAAKSDLARSPNRAGEGLYSASVFWWIVGVPMLVNALLLVLTWSILNGSFTRLFC
jgi:hypothetical protein